MDDSFEIYDLKVEVTATDRPMVCSHRVGDYFLVEGENLVFPEGARFSLYALGSCPCWPPSSASRTPTTG